MTKTSEKNSLFHNILTVIGVILCIILVPILIINCTLLIKGYTNTDEVPSIGGIFPLIVLTDSMYPEFAGGDLIICRTAEAESIQVGDIIAYVDPDGNGTSINTHRVIAVNNDENGLTFNTKGDANNAVDRTAVPADALVGIYSGTHIVGAGNVAMFMQTTTGLIVCVVLPLMILVGYDILRRKLYEKKHSQDKDQLLAELEELRRLKAEAEAKAEK